MLKDNEIQHEAVKKYLEKQNRGHLYEDIFEKCKSANHDDIKEFGNEVDKAFRAELDKYHKKCFQVSKLDPQVLEKARMGEFDERNNALIEHLICLSNNLGIQKDNEIQPEGIKTFLEKQNRGHFYEDISKKCKYANHDDIRVFVILYSKCAYQHAPKGTILL
ncbi:hypothetical protein WA026_018221 [Henosepilachna vigintioctopunctata]|uniref:Uncharacterized protein n=1 Tax=Henosepilachna vigintioctopunctata TaxID=420089 RepID=A0AAW1VDY7_9CUCU